MDYEEMKLECLRLANGDIDLARKFYDFCRGRGEGEGLRGMAIGTPFPPVLENEKVRVVGKDGNLGPFTDYVKDK